ncbi:MAG: FHA domain-containing protein [Deltaproteobacteria bacterium]
MADERHQTAYIIIHGPGHDGTRFVLREGITSFGRLPSNDMVLLGDLVSRHHTRIAFFEGRATIQDLGSHNGSWVNGERVTTRVLKDGDICRIGNFRVSFHAGPLPDGTSRPSFEETTNAETSGRKSTTDRTPQVPPGSSESVMLQQFQQARTGIGAHAKAMQVLLRASDALAAATDLESYTQEMLRLALDQTEAQTAAFVKRDASGKLAVAATRTAQRGPGHGDVLMRVVHWTITKNFGLTSDDVSTDIRFEGERARGPLAALSVPVGDDEHGVIGAMYLSRAAPAFHDGDLDVTSAIAHLMATAMTRARFLDKQTSANAGVLERVLSPDVANVVRGQLDAPEASGLEGKRATVVIADIPDLSAQSERTTPTEISRFLSALLDRAHEIARRQKGTLVPDAQGQLLFVFGAPRAYGDDPARAILAALELRQAVDQLAASSPALAQRPLRVGVEAGWLLAGPIGGPRRLTYAVLGDVVDAARENALRAAPGVILVGEAAAKLVASHFDMRKYAVEAVRGRPTPPLYEVVGAKRR